MMENSAIRTGVRSARMAISMVVLGLLVTGVPSPAGAGSREREVFPAYHDGQVVYVMMGPGGNSENRNQRPSACPDWGLGPDYSRPNANDRSPDHAGRDASRLPKMYVLFVPGANQMPCPSDTRRTHDMVLEAAPGERGYNASVHLVRCTPTNDFNIGDMPLTSAAAVIAAATAGKLTCTNTGIIASSPVVAR